jgi:hypothetical protein
MRDLHSRTHGFRAAAIALCGIMLAAAVPAQTLTRGPYLQMGTPTSQILRWRTDIATDSRVQLGASPTALNLTIDVATPTTEHAVVVTGLDPNTVYYYAVGTTATRLAGGDANHYFQTSPPTGATDPIRIWVLGDAGTAGPTGVNANQTAVRNAYGAFAAGRYTDLILLLGDNAYNSGTDAEYQNAVFNMYGGFLRQSNLWSTIGNHDAAGSTNPNVSTLPYFNIFTLPTAGEAGGLASGTEKYYSFDFGNVHFVCLDSMTSDRSVNGAMLTWLAADLAANTKPWIVAYWHHPPYSKGSHNSDTESQLIQMRENALPILESYGVDLVLSGHSHSYERSKLIGGHYGLSTTLTADMIKDGGSGRPGETGAYTKATAAHRAVYAVAGSSGQTSGGTLNHPVMYVSLNNLGSMILDVSGERLDATFLRENGTVADTFAIQKTPANVPPTVSLTSPANGATLVAPATVSLAATATDTDGSVARVDFYAGTTLLASDATAPYEFAWNAVAAGGYALTAKAVDDDGASTTSAAVNVTVTSSAPAAPSGLGATAVSTSQINLVWSDHSANESGFAIGRSTDGVTWTQIATVAANVTAYASTGLARNRTYRFRVRASGPGGDSAWSNVATAKTLRK